MMTDCELQLAFGQKGANRLDILKAVLFQVHDLLSLRRDDVDGPARLFRRCLNFP